MKRIFIALILIAALALPVCAQAFAIDDFFDGRYFNEPNATENILSGGKSLRKFGLSEYHGITLTKMPEEAAKIEKAVAADGKNAEKREIVYRDGVLHYAFLEMKPRHGMNRYIFYLNQFPSGGNKIVLIYLAGKADADSVHKMLMNK